MIVNPASLSCRSVGEWSFKTTKEYVNPFIDVTVDVNFTAPDDEIFLAPAFYDGDRTWRVRFNPGMPGKWIFSVISQPENPDLVLNGEFEVTESSRRGFLKSEPGKAWGFVFESGEPVFLLGDTVYHLFGMAHCKLDTTSFLQRRAAQGFNLLRVRIPVSPFHPPEGYSAWQTRRTWPWGGSEQSPRFDQFNLDYFHTVDQVMQQAESLNLGLEMIMEAWGFEFPFNSRSIFLPEWEELWMRYLIARYDAFNCVYIWTLMNEYEYYPNGDWHYKPAADRWAMRMARWVKGLAPHGHIVAVHNGPREPAFAQRFAADPQAVDTILFQAWGTTGKQDAWLAAGIEESINTALTGWGGSAIFAEYGYERNPDFPLLLPGHAYCDPEHTRRGAWRGAFCALGVIHGFENSWGPFALLDRDQQPGLNYLLHLHRFFTEIVPFQHLHPAPELVQPAGYKQGECPLALATPVKDIVAIYFPTGGKVTLKLPPETIYQSEWYDPRNGNLTSATQVAPREFLPLQEMDPQGHPFDWVLILHKVF